MLVIHWVFLVIAEKSGTFSSFPCSTNKQVCRSWEVAEPDRYPKLASGNVPYHGRYAQFINGDGWWGRNSLFFCEFDLFHEFELFQWVQSFSVISTLFFLWVWTYPWVEAFFYEFCNIHEFCDRCSGAGCTTSCWMVRKNCIMYCLFHIFHYYYCCCWYYYFLCYLIKLSLSSPTRFTFFPFSSPSHWGEEEWVSGCVILAASEWLHGCSCQLLG